MILYYQTIYRDPNKVGLASCHLQTQTVPTKLNDGEASVTKR